MFIYFNIHILSLIWKTPACNRCVKKTKDLTICIHVLHVRITPCLSNVHF